MTTTIRPRFQIGDRVWTAEIEGSKTLVTCPDCMGTGKWLAHLPCREQLYISCPTCERGWNSPGSVPSYEQVGHVVSHVITGIRTDSDEQNPDRRVEYLSRRTECSSRIFRDSQLYRTEGEAAAALPELVAERRIALAESQAASRARKRVDGPGRMASYYRSQIRAAKKELEQAKRGLARETAAPKKGKA